MQVVCRTPSGSFRALAQGSTRSTTPQYPFSKPVRPALRRVVSPQQARALAVHSAGRALFSPITVTSTSCMRSSSMAARVCAGGLSGSCQPSASLRASSTAYGKRVMASCSTSRLGSTGEPEILFLRDGRRRVERSGGLDLVYSNRPNRKLCSGQPDQRAVALSPQLVEALQSLGYPPDKSMAHSQAS